ncbi:hypothetical protein DENSPDRAFT_830309 [Dentipellis sp. KUC8613]|nr:hypothetical protein DENSPDRAFT_830309 [Dentipellis sp. KUC8613]
MPRTLPRLSREQRSNSPQPTATATPPALVPTIRLISATPSAHGSAADTSTTQAGLSFASSYVNVPAVSSPLAPKPARTDENAAPSTRRRLVPKRSKLGLLGGRSKDKDMSDVVRRVGGNAASSGRGGFEIYVDPAQDPDLGEVLLVKKKKSRAGLGGVGWGTLGERTNVPAAPKEKEKEGKEGLKIKTDEAQKWWTIGRGRKDSKEKKDKGKRSKSPEPTSATKFNSLDSGIMLSSPACFDSATAPSPQIPSVQAQTLRAEPIRHTSDPIPSNDASPAFLAPPGAPPASGSIALRAMRSMRSMARLASWAPPLTSGTTNNTNNNNNTLTKKDKEAAKKEKKKAKKEGRAQTLRLSSSSFEAGALTSPDCAQFQDKEDGGANKKKQSVLGLGLPSTMRFGSARMLSTTSNAGSARPQHPAINRLSNSSSVNLAPNDNRPRSGSEASSLNSARPLSTSSGMSGASSSSSTGSVKWDEEGIETVKERAARERAAAHRQAQIQQAARSETRHTSEGRRRAALADIFPDAIAESRRSSQASSIPMPTSPPIVTIEEATTDEHEGMDSSFETPQKRTRTRPISEQVGMRERPKAICDDVDGVLSILDAATNDLASLINRLDLEATPGTPNTPDGSPLRLPQRVSDLLSGSPSRASLGSPIKRAATMSGSPVKQAPVGLRTSLASVTSLRPYAQSRGHATASDPKAPATWARLGQQIAPWPISPTKPSPPRRSETAPAPSIPAFRLTHKRTLSPAPMADGPLVFRPLRPAKAKSPVSNALAASLSPVKGTSTPPTATNTGVPSSVTFGSSKPRRMADLSCVDEKAEAPSPTPVFRKAHGPKLSLETDMQARTHSPVPLSPEARKGLGLAGTLGEEDDGAAVESDDPDSDIPDELQVILSGQPDGDTEMLEDTLSFRPQHLPSPGLPPEMPLPTPEVSQAMNMDLDMEIPEAPVFRAQLINVDDHLAELDGSETEDDTKNRSKMSTKSKPSDGQLDVNFKFGGKTSTSPEKEQPKPLTLSDIIPPPAHVRSLSMSSIIEEDSSLLKSIFAKAMDIPSSSSAPRRRVNSDTSSKRRSRIQMLRDESMSSHSRGSSQASFSGMESFGEVRRGFEFPSDRPAFYPPQQVNARRGHRKDESVFSIASVSSYGMVLNAGRNDPFDYGQYPLPSRPSSDDMSFAMSMSVDDTFSFMHHRDSRRPRVDSDASSFYFRDSGSNQILQPLKRGHRQQDSVMSTASVAPPVSLYNRSFGGHRRNDSNSSASSVAMAYAKYGAGSRNSWARHRRDMSVDSMVSDMSALRVSRPGLGDKMLESALDYGMPLTSISASPPESVSGERLGNRTSFDSIIDGEPRSSAEDSLFEKTGHRTSVSSESVFDDDYTSYRQFRVPQFRPLSIISMEQSGFPSPKREDDTMITMLDGDHVRRRSIGSVYEGSPCVRMNKRKHAATRGPQHRVAGSEGEIMESPSKARILEKPSIASSSYSRFGNDHMIMASKGLLERQSLEEHCLVAEGEDHSHSFRPIPVFTRPAPANRSRSSTYTASSSGAETPPLSISDGSSLSSESESSVDLSHVSAMLANMTHPTSGEVRNRVRARARGHGHRRRVSAARASRSSVYETIEEEISIESPPRDRFLPGPDKTVLSPVPDHVMIVDAEESQSMEWDDERGVVALRKFYALKDEAHVTVEESKRIWIDTPFSIYAVQSFNPPDHPSGMQALLEHSQHTYGPLASDLRPRRIRSRTHSRPSPYPVASKASMSPAPRPAAAERMSTAPQESVYHPSPLQQRVFDANIRSSDISPFVPEKNGKNSFGLPARPRVGSNARRTALGWAKRSIGKENKENKENTSQGTIATPGDSLRISRPRPRGRPTPAARPQTIRV